MNIDCCKSYVGKQIIGLLPGGAEECLYVLGINAEDYGSNFFGDWTIDGEVFSDYLAANFGGNIYQNSTGYESCFIYYIGTQPTTINVTTELATIPFTINKVTDFEGGSCDLVCYQASFDYGYEWRFIDYFASGGVLPEQLGSAIPIDDATILYNELYTFLGPQITVTSVWNGSQYVVTINNAFNLGGFRLGDGAPVYTTFTALPCEITPPTPVPLALLDAYPGAGAAYSVRKLSSTYTGAALRVRRSSDNTEQDIGFVGIDLDTTSLSSFVGAGNGFVTKWYDQSGNNKDFFQNTGASQLFIVNSGTIYTSNGIPAIRINNATTNSMSNSLSTLQNLPVSIFTCFELISLPTNVYNNFAVILTGNGSTDDYGRYEIGVSNNNYFGQRRVNGSPFTNTNINDVTTNKRNIFAHLFRSTQINGYQNTNSYLGTAYNGVPYFNTSNFKIGKSNSTVIQNPLGHYQELIIYLSDQDSNNTGIRTNMNSYYSVY